MSGLWGAIFIVEDFEIKCLPFDIQIVGPNGYNYYILLVAHTLKGYLASNLDLERSVPDISSLSKMRK